MDDLQPTDSIKLDDIVALTEAAVIDCTPEWVTPEDMEAALDASRLSVQDIYAELNARVAHEISKTGVAAVPTERAAELVTEILLDRYKRALLQRTAHRVPMHTIR